MKLLLVDDGAQEFRISGGAQQISEKMAEFLGMENILFSKKVTNVCGEENNFTTVSCKDGTKYTGKFVICTAPPNQIAKMEFEPSMPLARKSLLQQMLIGNLVKFFIFYEKPFWTEAGFSGEVVATGGFNEDPSIPCEADGPLTILMDASTPNGTFALVGFSAGKHADQWMEVALEMRKKAIVKQLVKYFGPNAEDPKEIIEKDWRKEEMVEGAPICFLPPGWMHNYHYLR